MSVAGIAKILSSVGLTVLRVTLNIDGNEHRAEEQFTQQSINTLLAEYPGYNAIICHVGFQQNLQDATHYHYELPLTAPRTQGYEVFVFKSGEFRRQGDGGFENWCYGGKYVTDPNDSSHVTFFDPSPPAPVVQPPPPQHTPPQKPVTDGVYLVNSIKGNQISSGFAWYRDFKNSQGQQPGAYIDIKKDGYFTWEGAIGKGTFADGNIFECLVASDAATKSTGTTVGAAGNKFRSFTVYKSDYHVVYTIDGWAVHAVYYAE